MTDLHKKQRADKALPYLLSSPSMIIIILFLILPLVYCLHCSFWRCDYMQFSKFVGFQNYINVFSNKATIDSLVVSFNVSFVSLFLALVSGTLLALWIDSAKGKFAYVLELMILIPWVTSQVVAAMLWKWLLKDETGLINYFVQKSGHEPIGFLSSRNIAIISLIFVITWRVIGYVMVQLLAGLKTIPKELDEAALIDGVNNGQMFWFVKLPQLKTPMAISAIIVVLSNLNNLTVPLTLTGGGPGNATTVITILTYRESFSYYHFGEASALSIVLCVINSFLTVAYIKAVKYEI